MKTADTPLQVLFGGRDRRWLLFWIIAVGGLGVWDFMFLNRPALERVIEGFLNTFAIAFLVVGCTLAIAWIVTLVYYRLEHASNRTGFYLFSFFLNLIRSIPQIVGILFGYIGIAGLVTAEVLSGKTAVFLLMALCISFFIMLEVVDLLRERIDHYTKLDFFNAMRVCGVSQWRIINFDILWKNSRIHILNKLISVFGSAVFLQCSVDFIISVGLSSEVNAVTLPTTLGSLLAKMDSKQDILAIGNTITNISYLPALFFQHLQGITVAFLIVITLLAVYQISCGYAERHRL
ncbi:MAG: ABC transporter permease subunit [Chitinispirillaceae bacterium]|nr:ABC transporter permease subunit [Chitinispirillaceae bacterium]